MRTTGRFIRSRLRSDTEANTELNPGRMLSRMPHTGLIGIGVIVAVSLPVSMAVTVVVWAHNRNAAEKGGVPSVKAGAAERARPNAGAQGKRAVVSTERITLLHDGFEPDSITIPPKRFFLAVDNRSGLTEMALRLDRESGPLVHRVSIDHKKLDWSELFDLTPGRYVLSESNHPGVNCTITVTNK